MSESREAARVETCPICGSAAEWHDVVKRYEGRPARLVVVVETFIPCEHQRRWTRGLWGLGRLKQRGH